MVSVLWIPKEFIGIKRCFWEDRTLGVIIQK
jgi:hypothetical protein